MIKRRGDGRIEFFAHSDKIRDLYQKGVSTVRIHEQLDLSISRRQLARYIEKFITEPAPSKPLRSSELSPSTTQATSEATATVTTVAVAAKPVEFRVEEFKKEDW